MSIQSVEAAAIAYREAYEALKAEVVAAQDAGVSIAKVARAADVNRNTISAWTKAYRESGEESR